MRKALAVVATGLAILGTAGVAKATVDPTGPAKYGLCKAYFAGSSNGQAHKHSAPPFQALEQAAQDNNQSVEDFCSSATPGGR